MAKRITLIHATALSMQPVENAFREHWPDAERVNLLEDSLSRDRAGDGRLSAAMIKRFELLGDYAAAIGSDAILFTCSAFAEAIENVEQRVGIPVLKPNQAMLEAALEIGPRIGLLATFPATIVSMTPELENLAQQKGIALELHTRCAQGAMDHLGAGDAGKHDEMILQALESLPDVDVVMLAQFSMARAQSRAAARVPVPVLTAPAAAVKKLSAMVGSSAG